MLLVYMPYSSPRMCLGGWWGKRSSMGKSHSCQGTSATFSPLNHMVAVSSFLDVRLRDVHMSPCLLEFGVEISRIWFLHLKPFWLTLPGPLCPALLPVALGTSLHCCPMPPSPSLPVIKVKCIQWFCRERSWSDACAPVGFTHTGILVFCCICSKACRTSDAQCFFFLI